MTIPAAILVFFLFCLLCRAAFGRTPFIIISRAALFTESSIGLFYELTGQMIQTFFSQAMTRYESAKFAEVPLAMTAPKGQE